VFVDIMVVRILKCTQSSVAEVSILLFGLVPLSQWLLVTIDGAYLYTHITHGNCFYSLNILTCI